MRRFTIARLAIPLCAALAFTAPASAAPILGSDLETFAILGASAVTIAGTGSVINGNLGSYPTDTVTGVDPTNYTISNGVLQTGSGTAAFRLSAHDQLVAARVALGNTTATGSASSLGGMTLLPGVYSGATMDLTGTLTLDGAGNANALWIFNIDSTLITASSSVVNVINTGAGAGIYWNVGSSATLGSSSTFEGNILASASIGLGTTATIGCGRALAEVAAVTLDGTDTVSIGECDSNGWSGGGTIEFVGGEYVVVAADETSTTVPEPGTLALFGLGLAGLGFARRRKGI